MGFPSKAFSSRADSMRSRGAEDADLDPRCSSLISSHPACSTVRCFQSRRCDQIERLTLKRPLIHPSSNRIANQLPRSAAEVASDIRVAQFDSTDPSGQISLVRRRSASARSRTVKDRLPSQVHMVFAASCPAVFSSHALNGECSGGTAANSGSVSNGASTENGSGTRVLVGMPAISR